MTGFFDSGGSSRVATTDPAASDDVTRGYALGSTWTNSVTSTVFYCTSGAVNAAVWVALGAATTVGVYQTTGYFGVDSIGAVMTYGSFTSQPGSIV